jgi:DNA-binding MarR family transcriptional regulator
MPPAKRDSTPRPLAPSGEPIGYALTRLQQALRAALDDGLGPLGFTLHQVAVMAALKRTPNLSAASLARHCFVTPQAMGELLTGLEKSELIVRTPHESHGRMLPAQLTATGLAALHRCHVVVTDVETRMLSRLTVQEQTALGVSLDRCLEGLRTGGAQPGHRPPGAERAGKRRSPC